MFYHAILSFFNKGIVLLLPFMASTNLIVILGPTASGKTKLATHLAHALQTEIISADSRQVYKHMNLGTGKDYADYQLHNTFIPFHLIDIVEPGDQYHIEAFRNDFELAYNQIISKHKTPILCGGTGLYIDAIISNYTFTSIPVNETLRQKLQTLSRAELLHQFRKMPQTDFSSIADTSTAKRLIRAIEINTYLSTHAAPVKQQHTYQPIIIGLAVPLEVRRQRIADRLQARLQEGLINEVKELLKTVHPEKLIFYGLEYKFITEHLLGYYSYDEMVTRLTVAIQQFAKRQMTYFRKMERDGKSIRWIDATQPIQQQLEESLFILNQSTQ
jgi:tRNA dimethylallyltransferase